MLGPTLFFTVSLADRSSDALVRNIDILRWAVAKTRAERPFSVGAWVVLPDHMHCVWHMPNHDADYSTRWRLIKTRFSRGIPRATLRPGHIVQYHQSVWQRRFRKDHIRSRDELEHYLRYCWANPVKHGLVKNPKDWEFSSLYKDASVKAA